MQDHCAKAFEAPAPSCGATCPQDERALSSPESPSPTLAAFAVLYQILGALGASEDVLDLASAMANGLPAPRDPMELLPFVADSPFVEWFPTHQHRKGGFYQCLGVARMERTGEELVVYRDDQGQMWLRPGLEFEQRFARLSFRRIAQAAPERPAEPAMKRNPAL
jgi:hypothetical protein